MKVIILSLCPNIMTSPPGDTQLTVSLNTLTRKKKVVVFILFFHANTCNDLIHIILKKNKIKKIDYLIGELSTH